MKGNKNLKNMKHLKITNTLIKLFLMYIIEQNTLKLYIIELSFKRKN